MTDTTHESARTATPEEGECNCTQCRRERGLSCSDEGTEADNRRRMAERQRNLSSPRVAAENAARIAELLLLPRVRFVESLDTLRERVGERGWELLGGGAFSEAFGKGDLVWKITRKFAGHEDGGREYAADLAAGLIERNPHAPRVRLMLIDNYGDYAILMERMDGDMDDAGRDETRSVLASLSQGMGWFLVDDSQEGDPCFVGFVLSLRRRYESRYKFDLHGGNVMRRARDGEWVITDPISWTA